MKPKKKATPRGNMLAAESAMARGEAADAAAYAALQAEASIRSESERQALELFKRLEQMRERLVDVDMTFWPIRERVLRSQVQIGHIHDELVASGGQDFEALRLVLINALWWEIRAIGFLRKHPRGRKLGAIGANQTVLRALLEENPDADENTLRHRLKKVRPNYGLKDKSLKVEVARARNALRIKKS